MDFTFNYTKYLDKNPLQKLLLNNFFDTLFKMIDDLSVNRILDVGCGEGVMLEKFSKQNIGEYLEGVDNSKDALRLAKILYPNIAFKKGNIYNLSYKDNSFDFVACIEVLEHLERPIDAIQEIMRVTGRYVIFSIPNEPIFRIANFLRGRYIKDFGNTPGHINHWSRNSFSDLLQSQGVKIISIKTPFPWTIILGRKE